MNISNQQDNMFNDTQQSTQSKTTLNWKDAQIHENIHTKPYSWYLNIHYFIIGLFSFLFSLLLLRFMNFEVNTIAALAVPFFLLFGGLLLSTINYEDFKEYLSFKKTITKGEKNIGQIIGYCTDTRGEGGTTYYKLVVSYFDSVDEKTIVTPNLKLDLFSKIGSTDCSVYTYKNHSFAYDFLSIFDTGTPVNIQEMDNPKKKSHKIHFVIALVISIIIEALVYDIRTGI